MSEIFCFTYFLSGFLFRVRGRVGVRDGVGDGFRVRVRARWGQGFIHHNPNLLELKLRPSGKTRKKQKIRIGLEIFSEFSPSINDKMAKMYLKIKKKQAKYTSLQAQSTGGGPKVLRHH